MREGSFARVGSRPAHGRYLPSCVMLRTESVSPAVDARASLAAGQRGRESDSIGV